MVIIQLVTESVIPKNISWELTNISINDFQPHTGKLLASCNVEKSKLDLKTLPTKLTIPISFRSEKEDKVIASIEVHCQLTESMKSRSTHDDNETNILLLVISIVVVYLLLFIVKMYVVNAQLVE